jgi:cell shape-determining protein MreC
VPLAVLGIVPVKASAENGAIRPGDALTTSGTPGHAMKAKVVTVDGISFYPSGVLIGKALEGLDSGTGVIKMLVTLQ